MKTIGKIDFPLPTEGTNSVMAGLKDISSTHRFSTTGYQLFTAQPKIFRMTVDEFLSIVAVHPYTSAGSGGARDVRKRRLNRLM